MKNFRNLFYILSFLLFSFYFILPKQLLSAEESCSTLTHCEVSGSANPTGLNLDPFRPTSEDRVCIYYFYGAGCKACASLKDFWAEIEQRNLGKIELKQLEIYYNEENRQLFYDFSQRYKVENSGIPAVFIGDTYLGGVDPIKQNLQSKIDYFSANKSVCPLDYNRISKDTEEPQNLKLSLGAVLVGALVDSINPCAFAVLTLLLVYLLALKDKKTMLKVGLVYIIVVFIVYFSAGLGIQTLAKHFSWIFNKWIVKVVALFSVFAGLINIKDFFFYGKGISLKIPQSKRYLIEEYIKKASIPAAIVLGIMVSAFELPCTGGVYLAILSILAKSKDQLISYVYLLIYNLIFVAPLVIILLAVYKGMAPEKVQDLRLENRKFLRLFMGIVMILLGAGLFFNIF